jgi:transcriptional regulator with XRE-family HTH domain
MKEELTDSELIRLYVKRRGIDLLTLGNQLGYSRQQVSQFLRAKKLNKVFRDRAFELLGITK